jgi:hypothetical protein
VIFESGSRLEQIDESAFRWTGLKSIDIPASVIILDKECFNGCWGLESVTFESDSRLEWIDESVFHQCRASLLLVGDSLAVSRWITIKCTRWEDLQRNQRPQRKQFPRNDSVHQRETVCGR